LKNRRQPAELRPQVGLTLWLAGVSLLLALARLPMLRTPLDVSPDGCEYLGIARHLVTEGRWVSSIKWHFFTDGPVVHPALADRPPLYPLWAAAWVALSPNPTLQIWLARLGNLLLAALLPPLLYWALRSIVAPGAAGLTAVIFAFNPGFWRNSAQPLTEPLFLVLMFASLGLFLRAASPARWVTSGLLAGLSILARPSGLLLPPLYAIVLLRDGAGSLPRPKPEPAAAEGSPVEWPHQGRGWRGIRPWLPLLLVLGGSLLPLLPYWLALAAQTGSPFTSILRYNYSVRNIEEGISSGFERTFQPPLLFIWTHAAKVGRLIAGQWVVMGKALLRSLEFLAPLALFCRSSKLNRGRGMLLALAMLNFLFHAMSWTVWGAARYLFPTYILLTALLLDAPIRWSGRAGFEPRGSGDCRSADFSLLALGRPFSGGLSRLQSALRQSLVNPSHDRGAHPTRSWAGVPSYRRWAAAAALVVAVGLTLRECLVQDLRLLREKAQPYAGVHLGWAYQEAGRRLAQTPPGTLCAANQPWILNLLAGRPAVMAPRFRDTGQLRRYLAHFHPATLTLFVTEREPGDERSARLLVQDMWTKPRLRPDLAPLLELQWYVRNDREDRGPGKRIGRPPSQVLLMFRVRPAASLDHREAESKALPPGRDHAARRAGMRRVGAHGGSEGDHGRVDAGAVSAAHRPVSGHAAPTPHLRGAL
jgi:hypothetical protein